MTPLTDKDSKPFRMPLPEDDSVRRGLLRSVRPAFERFLHFPTLNAIYARVQANDQDDREFAEKALDELGVTIAVDEQALARLPTEGPLIVVANHPFGGIEGMVLATILRRVRPDVKLMANDMLSVIPDMRDLFFFVDVFGGDASARRNMTSIRSAISWVKDGGLLGVFPAGAVSHLHMKHRTVADPPWSPTIARIIQRTGAPVTPVFFDGRNSNLFQIMGMVHPSLRTAMLPREMLRRRDTTISAQIGNVIDQRRLSQLSDPDEMMSYLRMRAYILKTGRPDEDLRSKLIALDRSDRPEPEPIIKPIRRGVLKGELERLPKRQHLVTQAEFDVYYATAKQVPQMLREIGRLREEAFRPVGEGTGKSIDLDRFDQTYLHLFVWDRDNDQLVGAYRLGRTDRLLPRYGKNGVYTTTLFHIKTELLEQLDPAIELGRSFIQPEYQKSYMPLFLLWKGVATYVAHHPRYRRVFGCVSISAEYSTLSKYLMMAFLKVNKYQPQLGKLLKARNPPRKGPPRGWNAKQFSTIVKDLNEVNDLIADLEADGKPMPVLLRQYLKMNASLLGFNVDPEFGDVLDGLMVLDMTIVEPRTMGRYMGKEEFTRYLKYHNAEPVSK